MRVALVEFGQRQTDKRAARPLLTASQPIKLRYEETAPVERIGFTKGVRRRRGRVPSFPSTWPSAGSSASARCRRRRGDVGAGRRTVVPGSAVARRALPPRGPAADRRRTGRRDDLRRRAPADLRRCRPPADPTSRSVLLLRASATSPIVIDFGRR